MRSRKLFPISVTAILFTGCSPAPSITEPSATLTTAAGRPHLRPEDRQRLQDIFNHAPKGKELEIYPDNLFLPSGVVKVGEDPVLEEQELQPIYRMNPEYCRIKARLDYFDQVIPVREGHGKVNYQPGTPGRKVLTAGESFCFSAVKVVGKDGKPRYYVRKMSQSSVVMGFIEGQLPSPLHFAKFTREDFLNPQDVDWMLNVPDFEKIDLWKSQN